MNLSKIHGFLLDLDGTLYLGERLFEQTPLFIETLKQKNLPFICLTNNSSAATLDYVKKLDRLGIAIEPSQVITSGQATIQYLLDQTSYRSVYLVGTPALMNEFSEAGFIFSEKNPDCLVVAYDTTLDYQKLRIATRLLFQNKPYFATHPDKTCIAKNELLPDIAAIIAGLEAVTGHSPIILGKPEKPMVQAASARLKIPFQNLAIVGDQLDTDMTMARLNGLMSILVLSGETKLEHLEQSAHKPDLVISDIGELTDLLTRTKDDMCHRA